MKQQIIQKLEDRINRIVPNLEKNEIEMYNQGFMQGFKEGLKEAIRIAGEK